MHSQKGFSLVEGLLIVLVASVTSLGGYYVWSQNNNSKDNSVSYSSQDKERISGVDKDSDDAVVNYDDLYKEIISSLQIADDSILRFAFVGQNKAVITDDVDRKFVFKSDNIWQIVFSTREDPSCDLVADINLDYRPGCYNNSGRVPGAYEPSADGYYLYKDF